MRFQLINEPSGSSEKQPHSIFKPLAIALIIKTIKNSVTQLNIKAVVSIQIPKSKVTPSTASTQGTNIATIFSNSIGKTR